MRAWREASKTTLLPRGGTALSRCGLVEESKLGCIGGFELPSPFLKIFVLDRRGARQR
jgi:hypothetical protein